MKGILGVYFRLSNSTDVCNEVVIKLYCKSGLAMDAEGIGNTGQITAQKLIETVGLKEYTMERIKLFD